MTSKRIRTIAGWMLAPLLVAGAVAAQAGAASAATTGNDGHHTILYVSPHASSRGADRSCRSARFRTIQSAVNAAGPGGTVVVCQGTYHEQVVMNKPVSLQGQRATIDEAGVKPAFQVTLPGLGTQTIFAAVVMVSSGIRFSGFTVTHAQGEGILAAGLGRDLNGISISDSAVVHNDLGFGVPNSPYFECAAQGQAPGDCGEGVHFTGVAYSAITGSSHRVQRRRGPAERRHRAHAPQPGGRQRRHRQLHRLRNHRSRAQPGSAQRQGPAAAVGGGRLRQRHPRQHGNQQRREGRGRRSPVRQRDGGHRLVRQPGREQLHRRERAVWRDDARPHHQTRPVRGPQRQQRDQQLHRQEQPRRRHAGLPAAPRARPRTW